jgi:hypothetical protein
VAEPPVTFAGLLRQLRAGAATRLVISGNGPPLKRWPVFQEVWCVPGGG